MTEGIKSIIYPVKDVAKAKALFTLLLGVEPYADEEHVLPRDTALEHATATHQ